MRAPLAAHREPTGDPEQATNCSVYLEHKNNIFFVVLHTAAPWHLDISVIYIQGFHSQIC